MKNINWKLRFKNKATLLAIASTVILLIQQLGFKYKIKDISVSFGLEKQSDIKVYIKSTASMTVYVNGLETSYISSDGYITIKDVHSNAVFIQIYSNEQTDFYGLEVV